MEIIKILQQIDELEKKHQITVMIPENSINVSLALILTEIRKKKDFLLNFAASAIDLIHNFDVRDSIRFSLNQLKLLHSTIVNICPMTAHNFFNLFHTNDDINYVCSTNILYNFYTSIEPGNTIIPKEKIIRYIELLKENVKYDSRFEEMYLYNFFDFMILYADQTEQDIDFIENELFTFQKRSETLKLMKIDRQIWKEYCFVFFGDIYTLYSYPLHFIDDFKIFLPEHHRLLTKESYNYFLQRYDFLLQYDGYDDVIKCSKITETVLPYPNFTEKNFELQPYDFFFCSLDYRIKNSKNKKFHKPSLLDFFFKNQDIIGLEIFDYENEIIETPSLFVGLIGVTGYVWIFDLRTLIIENGRIYDSDKNIWFSMKNISDLQRLLLRYVPSCETIKFLSDFLSSI